MSTELFAATKRWGRWGDADDRGALNLLTPERVANAAGLVADGAIVPCGRRLATAPAIDNPTPALHHMIHAGDVAAGETGPQWCGDFVGVACHGNNVSHIDALCHVFVDGRMYNGAPATEVTSVGARRSSIEVAETGIVGRGVLLDIPQLRGVSWLEPGDAITPEELDATGVYLEQGDIVLVHTGRDRRREAHGPWNTYTDGLAGLHPECARWLYDKDPSVLGCDGVSDVMPGPDPEWPIAIHMCAIVGMGIHLLDNLRLDLLADACAERNRWEFLFVVAPLQIGGGTGSPVNPIAIF
ncbi:MAG TPA: cyclase family protein [Acidimicrobiales bacterium]|nr:cyclase family protein [Acidimicrobiales bacterium]